MEEQVLKTIRTHQLISPGDRILIGVSGGADSMALLTLLIRLKETLQCEICAAHLHHDMRGADADADADYVRNYCQKYQIPFCFRKTNVLELAAAEKIGVEEAGRKARYAFFKDIMAQWDCSKLAVAHHMNDRAETLLFRLIRGTGLTGAAAIRYQEGRIIRPLLDVARKDIEHFCTINGLLYRHDCTNDDDSFMRNRLRHQVFPMIEDMNPAAVKHFADFCNQIRETNDFIREQTEAAANRLFQRSRHGLTIDIHLLNTYPSLIRRELFRKAVGIIGGSMVDVERRHIESIEDQLTSEKTIWVLDLPHQVHVLRQYDVLLFADTIPSEKPLKPIKVDLNGPGIYAVGDYLFQVEIKLTSDAKKFQNCKKSSTFFISCGTIYNDIFFRHRQTGDKIHLPGMSGNKSVKKLLIDRKIPSCLRDSIPVLAMGNRVLWIPGVATEAFRCSETANEKIIKITMERTNES